MPFKKPSNKKNTTKKQQKKAITMTPSSVEETQTVNEAVTNDILSEEEIAAYEQYMWENYYEAQQKEDLKNWQNAQIAMLEDPEYWDNRRSELLRHRECFHKKRAWSPEIIHEVDSLDKKIQECEEMMDMLDGFEKEVPVGNAVLGGFDWWKDDFMGKTDEWVSSR